MGGKRMRKVGDKPNCCKEGSEFIWWTDFYQMMYWKWWENEKQSS